MLNWREEENIKLRSQPAVVPLSVYDELAFVAGIYSSLNTPSFTTKKCNRKGSCCGIQLERRRG